MDKLVYRAELILLRDNDTIFNLFILEILPVKCTLITRQDRKLENQVFKINNILKNKSI